METLETLFGVCNALNYRILRPWGNFLVVRVVLGEHKVQFLLKDAARVARVVMRIYRDALWENGFSASA